MRRVSALVVRVGLAATLGVLGVPAAAQVAEPGDPALEARVTKLATELRCPVCQGLAIQDSPSELAIQMKAVIRGQLLEGKTNQEVKDYFVSKYGEWVLLEPKASGFNLLVYLLPLAALLGGAAVVVAAVRRWTTPAEEA